MASAGVDEADTRPPRDGPNPRRALPPEVAVATAAVALSTICFCLCLLLLPSPSPALPASLVYPRFAEAAVRRAAAITAVASADEYDATALLGNGTFGRVVEARHRASGGVVAIKSLRSERKNGPYDAGAAEVLGEARLLAAGGGHPSVVALRAVAVHPATGELSLVMERAGHTLLRELYLHRGGAPFPERDARRVMRRLLAGAAHMHARGVVHRDIKPHNVLVSGGGGGGLLADVKIADLGIAAPAAAAKGRFGTATYMAPEILAGKARYSEKVDMWSLGSVMAELLGGKPLFYVEKDDDDAARLRMIFDVLGPPCPGGNSKQQQAGKAATTPPSVTNRNRLRDFFPEHRLSDEGFDVLKGLLSCDVDARLSATNALRLPWFAHDVDEALSVSSR